MAHEDKGHLEVEDRGAVLIVRVDGGPHGLFGLDIANQLEELVDRVDRDPSVHAVVLTGAHPERFVSHDTQIARPGQLRAEAERRTVKGGNEDGAAGVHPQERRVQAVLLDGTPQRGPAHHGLQDTGSVRDSGHACYRCGAASAQRRDRSTPFL